MKEELEELLEVVGFELTERLNRFDKFSDKEYEQGIRDGITICIGIVNNYQ